MVELLIGFFMIMAMCFVVRYIHSNGLHLSEYDRVLRMIGQYEDFIPSDIVLIQTNIKPAAFVGFVLDDTHNKFMCFNEVPGLVCNYDQILEWRVLVNNRSVACLSRLSSSDLMVDEPERDLELDDFLRKYCNDQRPDPLLESVCLKFLIRDLGYPVHSFSMHGVDQGSGDLILSLQQALSQIDKFKIVMYQG